jgi:hypothetical protein
MRSTTNESMKGLALESKVRLLDNDLALELAALEKSKKL